MKSMKVPGLCDSIGMDKAIQFIRIAAHLKDAITASQPPHHDATAAPDTIPDNIQEFLGSSTDMPINFVDGCWKAFGNLIWEYDENGKTKGADAQAFTKHGLDHLLCNYCAFSLYRSHIILQPLVCSFPRVIIAVHPAASTKTCSEARMDHQRWSYIRFPMVLAQPLCIISAVLVHVLMDSS
jgi:hypothetical protein